MLRLFYLLCISYKFGLSTLQFKSKAAKRERMYLLLNFLILLIKQVSVCMCVMKYLHCKPNISNVIFFFNYIYISKKFDKE